MNTFKKLFAVDQKDIKENVIITPFLNLEHFVKNKGSKINKGFIFQVLTEKYYSVVKTGVGSTFVGDCVVYLKDTLCKRLYFIGSCGVVSNFNIGDLVIVNKVMAWESFSEVLNRNLPSYFISMENELTRKLSILNRNIKKANLATLGSLSLQKDVFSLLKKHEVDVVDMEVSSFFSAAKHFRLQGLALLYATDVISNKPFFRDLDKKESEVIKSSRQRAISLICEFIMSLNA